MRAAHARAMLNSHTFKLALTVVAVAVALTGAQTAHAVTTCGEGGRVLTVSMTQHRDAAILTASSAGYIRVESVNGPVPCTGVPDTTVVDTILINDLSNDPATQARDDGATTVDINEPAGFAPGYTQEPSLPSEIEFLADMKGGEDRLILEGNKPHYIEVGDAGVNWNNDLDADMIGVPFKHVELWGSNSADRLSGQGGPGVGGPLSTSTTFKLLGFDGSDTLLGTNSARGDHLEGGTGPDAISGMAGDDSLQGDAGDDLLDGGAGADAVRYSGSGITVNLSQTGEQDTGQGRDTLNRVEKAYGGAGSDHLIGNTDANELDGGDGDDVLEGRGGADEMRGGAGSDTVSYAAAPAGVTIDLGRADQATDGDRLYFMENVIGSPFGDALTGGGAPRSRLVGGAGTDVVTAGTGDDLIEVRDGESDRVICGDPDETGTVTVTSDRRSVDAVASLCQNVDALPEPQVEQPGQGTGAPDTTLRFTLRGAKRQRLLRQKAVHVKVGCPLEACTTVATSSGKLRLRPLTAGMAAGTARTLKLRLTRKQLATIRKALTARRRPLLTVRVVARDGAGNTVQRVLRITAVR